MSTITTTVSAIPLLRHRNTVSNPADQDDFVTKYEATNDALSNNLVSEINDIGSEINVVAGEASVNTGLAQTAAINTGTYANVAASSANYQGDWSAGTYTLAESVTHNGYFWAVKVASTTGEPSVSSDWTKISENDAENVFVASGALTSGALVCLRSDGTVEIAEYVDIVTGAPVVFESASTFYTSIAFDSTNNKLVIAYRDNSNTYFGTAVVGTVSGTAITFGTPVVFESASTNYISIAFDSTNNKLVIAYRDDGNTYFGTSITLDLDYSNFDKLIGITTEEIADTSTGTITTLSGVNEQQSGLTTGDLYSIDENNILTNTPTGDHIVNVGRAISSTKIILKGFK